MVQFVKIKKHKLKKVKKIKIKKNEYCQQHDNVRKNSVNVLIKLCQSHVNDPA